MVGFLFRRLILSSIKTKSCYELNLGSGIASDIANPLLSDIDNFKIFWLVKTNNKWQTINDKRRLMFSLINQFENQKIVSV